MVIDHAHGLQERIGDRSANETRATALQVFGNGRTALCWAPPSGTGSSQIPPVIELS